MYSTRSLWQRVVLPKLVCLLAVFLLALTSAAGAQTSLRLDADKDKPQPRNWRLMTDAWHREFSGAAPSREGLDKLNISASAQPSVPGFQWILSQIKSMDPSVANIYVLDLRQESHGYANDVPVSLYVKHNIVNFGKSDAEVEASESKWLESLKGKTLTFVPLGKTDPKLFGPLTLTITKTQTEEQVVKEAGMRYARFSTTNSSWPEPQTVDRFVEFVRNLPENTWLHFHCHAGHGRTTSFVAMYDRMRNPQVDLETIVRRQYLLDGTDILAPSNGNGFTARAERNRAQMIKRFDRYARELDSKQTSLAWSEWLKQNFPQDDFIP